MPVNIPSPWWLRGPAADNTVQWQRGLLGTNVNTDGLVILYSSTINIYLIMIRWSRKLDSWKSPSWFRQLTRVGLDASHMLMTFSQEMSTSLSNVSAIKEEPIPLTILSLTRVASVTSDLHTFTSFMRLKVSTDSYHLIQHAEMLGLFCSVRCTLRQAFRKSLSPPSKNVACLKIKASASILIPSKKFVPCKDTR